MALDEKDIAKKFNLTRVLFPIVIGLGVAMWLLISNLSETRYEPAPNGGEYVWVDANGNGAVDKTDSTEFVLHKSNVPANAETFTKTTALKELKNVNFTWYTLLWILVALAMVVVRDLGYMYRIRVLTDGELSWRKAFDVIMLWEFASALTPSVVGGAGVAVFIVNREGVPLGKSSAVVLVTALMDELFYILMVPIVLLIVGTKTLFEVDGGMFGMDVDVTAIFWAGYAFLVLLTLIILFSIFLWPAGIKKLLFRIFNLRFLKRWRKKAVQTGQELVDSSQLLRGKPFSFWAKTFGATFFSWTARFWIVNFMILAFTSNSLFDNFMIYAKQLVMWVIMLISPTPGSSGVAEVAFSAFLKDFMPVALPAIVLAVLWRLFSYYPYLFVGSIILPRWLRRTAMEKAQREEVVSD